MKDLGFGIVTSVLLQVGTSKLNMGTTLGSLLLGTQVCDPLLALCLSFLVLKGKHVFWSGCFSCCGCYTTAVWLNLLMEEVSDTHAMKH
jgi:hypothetical protein